MPTEISPGSKTNPVSFLRAFFSRAEIRPVWKRAASIALMAAMPLSLFLSINNVRTTQERRDTTNELAIRTRVLERELATKLVAAEAVDENREDKEREIAEITQQHAILVSLLEQYMELMGGAIKAEAAGDETSADTAIATAVTRLLKNGREISTEFRASIGAANTKNETPAELDDPDGTDSKPTQKSAQ